MTQDAQNVAVIAKQIGTPWRLQAFDVAVGWGAFILEQRYPVLGDRHAYKNVFAALLNAFQGVCSTAHAEAFLQMDRIDFRRDIALVQEHNDVLGDYGLGVYPDNGPPATWTKEEFLDKMAPENLRPLAFDVMMVDAGSDSVPEVRSAFLGSGAYTETYCPEGALFYEKATAEWRPTITDPILRTFPYLAPLLTLHAVASADASTLERWTCGALLYLRESIEDGGLLVLQRGDIRPALDRMRQALLLSSQSRESTR